MWKAMWDWQKAHRGLPPSYVELTRLLGVSPNSTNLVFKLMRGLEAEGRVEQVSGRWVAVK